ncbi:hypothetical protein GJAV_G00154520 [Gymnothorax javanicus]|nr:hypothetical protein GJAV_G00154520 [Gymnothorax javanicus]
MARVLLLLVGFLLRALGDIRARDPEVEEDRIQGRAAWDPQMFGTDGTRLPIPGYNPLPVPVQSYTGSPEESGEFQNYAPRSGNWCGFVHQRTVSTAVYGGSERYIAKSRSLCPIGPSDCQLVLYKLAVRPVYKERPKIVTSLLWRCCPGYGGRDCEVTEADAHATDPGGQTTRDPREGLDGAQQQGTAGQTEDHRWEQRDFHVPEDPLGNSPLPAVSAHNVKPTDEGTGGAASAPVPVLPASGTVPLHQTTAALMAQLFPVLDSFNRTLKRLSREVGRLSHGLAELQRDQKGGSPRGGGGARAHNLEARLQESTKQIGQVRALLTSRQNELEGRLESQHAALHHHLTTFKADTDSKITQNQASLRLVNTTLAELKLKQLRLEEMGAEGSRGESWHGAAIWQAVGRLETKVLSNAAKVTTLEEKSNRAMHHLRSLQRGLKSLEGQLALNGRKTQDHFANTALDVEAAQSAVLDRVTQLADNLTTHKDHLSEINTDLRYIQDRVDGYSSPQDCDCTALANAVSELRRDLASTAEVAEENRRSYEEGVTGKDHQEGEWDGSLSDLRQGFLLISESLDKEKDKGQAALLNISHLQATQHQIQQDVRNLLQRDEENTKEIRRLSGSFSSLLQDAIRHSEVLEVLLGEEVLQFKELPAQEQQEYSILLLQKRILLAEDQLKSHAMTLAALGGPAANKDSLLSSSERFKRESNVVYGLEDYSVGDFWSLRRELEKLRARLKQLEHRSFPSDCCNRTAVNTAAPTAQEEKLQDEAAALGRRLGDHLRVLRRIFGNMSGSAYPNGTVDLDILRAALKGADGRKKQTNERKRTQREGKVEGWLTHAAKEIEAQ